jgi:uncharacterized protein (DUF362 family)
MAVLCTNGKKDMKSAFRRILDTYIPRDHLSRGIFLKPNIVFPVHDNSGEITRLLFIKSLIETIRERTPGVDIVIGEGVAAGCDPQQNFNVSGYARLARELNVALVDLHKTERSVVSWKFGSIELPRLAFDRIYISLPILKSSSACVISGALKNQKGLVLPAVKKQFHYLGLHEQIAQLNVAVRPSLTILDCGNFFGSGIIIAGNNNGEIDAAVCKYLEIEEPEHLQRSREAGLFHDGFTVAGDTIDKRKIRNRPCIRQFKSLGRLRLWSNSRACSMCRYLFHDLSKIPRNRKMLATSIKLARYAINGAEVLMGSEPKFTKDRPDVICIGECTKALARKNGFIHIPGCPPKKEDVHRFL